MHFSTQHALNLLAQRLLFLRGAGIVLVAGLLLLAQQINLSLAYPNLVLITLAWLVMHGSILVLQKNKAIHEKMLLLQLASDLLVVACLLAFSGGVHNPFFALLILPLLLSVGIISRQGQWILLLLFLVFSGGLVWFPLANVSSGMPQLPPEVYQLLFSLDGTRITDMPFNPKDTLAKLGIWLNLSLIAILVSLLLARLHQRLQDQHLALEKAYHQQQEQAHLLQLGLTAAATAHELATPLATISLLASEAKDAYAFDEFSEAEIALDQIQQLVKLCKTHINHGLVQQAYQDSGTSIPCDLYLKQQLAYWQNMRPQARAILHPIEENASIPYLTPSSTLGQILVTLLNNAADASDEACQVSLTWNHHHLTIRIHNVGQGFDAETLATFPAPQISQKLNGHGIGLSLAYYQAQQLAGELELRNTFDGAEVLLHLPSVDKEKE
jgi:two-component system sensor histidine kinase RegB